MLLFEYGMYICVRVFVRIFGVSFGVLYLWRLNVLFIFNNVCKQAAENCLEILKFYRYVCVL